MAVRTPARLGALPSGPSGEMSGGGSMDVCMVGGDTGPRARGGGRQEGRVAAALDQLVRSFSQRRVLVLGDMVADEYLVGRPHAISREAPVLILHYAQSFV